MASKRDRQHIQVPAEPWQTRGLHPVAEAEQGRGRHRRIWWPRRSTQGHPRDQAQHSSECWISVSSRQVGGAYQAMAEWRYTRTEGACLQPDWMTAIYVAVDHTRQEAEWAARCGANEARANAPVGRCT